MLLVGEKTTSYLKICYIESLLKVQGHTGLLEYFPLVCISVLLVGRRLVNPHRHRNHGRIGHILREYLIVTSVS